MAIVNQRGRLTLLRINKVGTRFGGINSGTGVDDSIDVEVVIKIDSMTQRSMGFQLRDDEHRIANEAMLSLLRLAWENNELVSVDHDLEDNRDNGLVIRVWLERRSGGVARGGGFWRRFG